MPIVPTSEPATIVAGDTSKWNKTFTQYPSTAGWTLTYSLQLIGSTQSPYTFTTSGNADGTYSIALAPTTTVQWSPGKYIWIAFVGNGTDRYKVQDGIIGILPNPQAAGTTSHAQRTLALLEAAIEGRIPAGFENTTIGGITLSRIPAEMLLKLRDQYLAKVLREEEAALALAGVANRRRIGFRFDRAGGSTPIPQTYPFS